MLSLDVVSIRKKKIFSHKAHDFVDQKQFFTKILTF